LPIEFQIRKLLLAEEDQASILADIYNAKYITGGYRDAVGNWVKEPELYMPFVDLGVPKSAGEAPEIPPLGYGLLVRCANLQAMQPEAPRYSMDQLLQMSVVAPDGFAELIVKANRIAAGGESNQGNASTGD